MDESGYSRIESTSVDSGHTESQMLQYSESMLNDDLEQQDSEPMYSHQIENYDSLALYNDQHNVQPANTPRVIQEYDPGLNADIERAERSRIQAVRVWSRRCFIISIIQIAPFGYFLSLGWMSAYIQAVLFFFGFIAVYQQKVEYTFVYLVCNIMEFVKDFGLLVLYNQSYYKTTTQTIGMGVLIFDMLVIQTVGTYCAYYLYTTQRRVIVA